LEAGDFQERWDIAKLISQFGVGAIAPVLDRLANADDDWELQWHLIRVLGCINHPDAIAALIAHLSAPHSDVAQAAAIALASIGKPAIPSLVVALQTPSARSLAAQTLAQINDPAIIPAVSTVVDDADPSVRSHAIEALIGFPNETVLQQQSATIISILLAALKDPNASVRRAAVTGLGLRSHLFDPPLLVLHIQPLLYDLNLDVCQQAAIALSRLGTEASITALSELLRSPHTPEPLIKTAIHGLVWMEIPAAIAALKPYVHQCLETPDSPALAQDVITTLGQVESPDLRQSTTELLLSSLDRRPLHQWNPTVLKALAIALGRLQHPSALHPLIQLLSYPHTTVQLHAIAALKHFDTAHAQLQAIYQSPTTAPELNAGIAIALREWTLSDRSS
jgi:HEAT repeat protein